MNITSYYYFKFKPLRYEDEPYYLCMGNNIRKNPVPLKIFNSIEDALEYRYNEFDEEAFRSIFEDYEISIERL